MSELTPDNSGLLCCPCCGREWERHCEQTISIERYGECVVCKFTSRGKGSNDGTPWMMDAIADEAARAVTDAWEQRKDSPDETKTDTNAEAPARE